MNKAELVAAVADKTGITKKDAEKVINSTVDTIQEALSRNEKVSLVGFGTFEVRQRAARKGRNPKTGQEISIDATRVPVFRAGKALKDMIK